MYNQKDLDRLWNVIRGETWGWGELETGLVEVNFKVPLTHFKRVYKEKIWGKRIPLVFTDIKKVIEELSDAFVDVHHFSCASFTKYGTNSAICIHYTKPNGKFYALSIPGINYVPEE